MKTSKFIIGVVLAIIIAALAAAIAIYAARELKNPWDHDVSRDYVYNEQLPYYRKDKQTVMKMLPKPASDYIDTIYVDSVYNFWPQYAYQARLEKEGNSTMTINIVDWFLDERKSRLQIIFVQEDSLWIADYAGQWNPEGIYF